MSSLPAITTAARRIARNSRRGWRQFVDATGNTVTEIYDPERNTLPPTNVDYAFEVGHKISQRDAQDRLDAWTQLLAAGYDPRQSRGLMGDVLASWHSDDETGHHRNNASAVIAWMRQA